MGFGMLAYNVATGGSVTDFDMTAYTDSDFSQRNNHYIFTENYRLMAHGAFGANLTRLNVSVPQWNALSKFNLWPLTKSADIPSSPLLQWFPGAMPVIPQNEEYAVKVTDSASETPYYFMWIVTDNWNMNLPAYKLIIPVRVTASITIVANAWSLLGALTFEQSLRGGTYAVVGAQFQGTHMMAFRLVFPKYQLAYGKRKLRPGALAQNAIGDEPEQASYMNPYLFGEWGRFFTFEQPQLEILGNTAGATTIEGRLWLAYLGEQDLTGQGMAA